MPTKDVDGSGSATVVLRRIPTQARSRQKVDRALEAAQALLEREGVAALTLSRVAKEAEVSVGALYQYLPDREAIVAALTATYHARHEARMDDLVADLVDSVAATKAADPVGAVISGVAGVYREQARGRALRAELQAASNPALTREHKHRMVGKVRELLAAYELVAPDDLDLVARALFFAADGLMHEAFAHSEDGDPALLAELEALLRSYLDGRARHLHPPARE